MSRYYFLNFNFIILFVFTLKQKIKQTVKKKVYFRFSFFNLPKTNIYIYKVFYFSVPRSIFLFCFECFPLPFQSINCSKNKSFQRAYCQLKNKPSLAKIFK